MADDEKYLKYLADAKAKRKEAQMQEAKKMDGTEKDKVYILKTKQEKQQIELNKNKKIINSSLGSSGDYEVSTKKKAVESAFDKKETKESIAKTIVKGNDEKQDSELVIDIENLEQTNEKIPYLGIARNAVWGVCIALFLTAIVAGMIGTFSAIYSIHVVGSIVDEELYHAFKLTEAVKKTVDDSANIPKDLRASVQNISDSINKASEGMQSISSTIGVLGSVPLVGGAMDQGSSAKFKQSSQDLRQAAEGLDSVSEKIGMIDSDVSEVSSNMASLSKSIKQARESIKFAVLTSQIAVLGIGVGFKLCSVGCLLLALTIGPPRNRVDES